MQNDRQVQNFMAAIQAETDKRRQEIERQTNAYIETELSEAENRILQESYRLIQQGAERIRSETGRTQSQKMAAFQRALIEKRAQIVDRLFETVEQMLAAFIKTPAYESFLLSCAGALAARIGSVGLIYLCGRDMVFEARISAALPGFQLREDPAIRLGGVKLASADGRRTLDDTLDARLARERENFLSTNDLILQSLS